MKYRCVECSKIFEFTLGEYYHFFINKDCTDSDIGRIICLNCYTGVYRRDLNYYPDLDVCTQKDFDDRCTDQDIIDRRSF